MTGSEDRVLTRRSSTRTGLRKFIAGYQIAAALVFAAAVLWPGDWGSIDIGRLLLAIALSALGLAAGIRLWSASAGGFPLTMLNQALQVPSLAAPTVAWNFSPVISAVVGADLIESELTLGLTLALEPLLHLERAADAPVRLGFDLVPLIVLWLLFRSARSA